MSILRGQAVFGELLHDAACPAQLGSFQSTHGSIRQGVVECPEPCGLVLTVAAEERVEAVESVQEGDESRGVSTPITLLGHR